MVAAVVAWTIACVSLPLTATPLQANDGNSAKDLCDDLPMHPSKETLGHNSGRRLLLIPRHLLPRHRRSRGRYGFCHSGNAASVHLAASGQDAAEGCADDDLRSRGTVRISNSSYLNFTGLLMIPPKGLRELHRSPMGFCITGLLLTRSYLYGSGSGDLGLRRGWRSRHLCFLAIDEAPLFRDSSALYQVQVGAIRNSKFRVEKYIASPSGPTSELELYLATIV